MQEQTLYEQADTIINQKSHTDDDIKDLARIKYKLTRLVRQYDVIANWLEEEYNKHRWSAFVEIKRKYKDEWHRITDSEAERYAKDKSEDEYWSYRSSKANVRWMYAEIWAIEQFIITIQSERKAWLQSQKTIDQIYLDNYWS